MRAMTFFGSLVLSAALCGQGFGGERAPRLLGLDSFDNCAYNTYAPCDSDGPVCGLARPFCPALRERLCGLPIVCRMFAREMPGCEEEVDCCGDGAPRWTPVRNLLTDLRIVLFPRWCPMDSCYADDCGGCGYSTVSDDNAAPMPAPVEAAPMPKPDAPEAIPTPDTAPIPPAPEQ